RVALVALLLVHAELPMRGVPLHLQRIVILALGSLLVRVLRDDRHVDAREAPAVLLAERDEVHEVVVEGLGGEVGLVALRLLWFVSVASVFDDYLTSWHRSRTWLQRDASRLVREAIRLHRGSLQAASRCLLVASICRSIASGCHLAAPQMPLGCFKKLIACFHI